MTDLSGTGRVGDDLYLIAHHERHGRPYVQPRALGLGLAGSLLTELMLEGHVGIWNGQLVVTDNRRPDEALADRLLKQLVSEYEHHSVRDWLLYIARTAADDISRRLEVAGYLVRSGRRWRGNRLVPVDADSAFAPMLRARAALDASGPPTDDDAVLAGLITACGLGFRLAQYAPTEAGRSVDQAIAQLDAGLRDLIIQTRAAVESALLAHRM
jgi:hypothetical protein